MVRKRSAAHINIDLSANATNPNSSAACTPQPCTPMINHSQLFKQSAQTLIHQKPRGKSTEKLQSSGMSTPNPISFIGSFRKKM